MKVLVDLKTLQAYPVIADKIALRENVFEGFLLYDKLNNTLKNPNNIGSNYVITVLFTDGIEKQPFIAGTGYTIFKLPYTKDTYHCIASDLIYNGARFIITDSEKFEACRSSLSGSLQMMLLDDISKMDEADNIKRMNSLLGRMH